MRRIIDHLKKLGLEDIEIHSESNLFWSTEPFSAFCGKNTAIFVEFLYEYLYFKLRFSCLHLAIKWVTLEEETICSSVVQ